MNRSARLITASVCAWVVGSALSSSAVAVPVPVQFSGGNGTPLTITFPEPITFVVTAEAPAGNPSFVIKGAGEIADTTKAATGTLSHTYNGGPASVIDRVFQSPGAPGGVFNTNDIVLFTQDLNIDTTIGDVFVLGPGSTVTTPNVNFPAPASGLYEMTLLGNLSTQIAVGVPEPATAAALMVFTGLLAARRNRRTIR